jgi:Na+-translocating ferredoxin:NAD+ oxidoreductase subunit C
MSRRLWPLPGGIHPPSGKQPAASKPIGRLPLASHFYLPLLQERGYQVGEPLEPLVAPGTWVLKGQLLARGTGTGRMAVPLHAPTSGQITRIGDWPLTHPSGLAGPCIQLTADGQDRWIDLPPAQDPFTLDRSSLLNAIQQAGICGMGGAGYPTAAKLDTAAPVHTLILNGTECEPYISCDDRLMQEAPLAIWRGGFLAQKILGAQQVLLAIEDDKPAAEACLRASLRELGHPGAEVVVLPSIYPSGGTKQLVQQLSGQEVPSGQQASSLGYMVLNVATAQAIWRACTLGEPLIERVTTLTGRALSSQQNFWVPLGTPVQHLLDQLQWPEHMPLPILGGPLMGYRLADTRSPVLKTSNCIIAPSLDEFAAPAPESPCIRCGHCDSVCPAQLLPQQLLWYSKAHDTARLQSHHLFDCIECGACSYVCPSSIPLVQHYRAAKARLRTEDEEKLKADTARARFAARQERQAAVEAAKAAKREARQAAASALQQLDTHKAVAAAMAEVQANIEDPAEQEAKLQRHRLSAQDRVNRLQQQWEERHSLDAAQQEKLAASLKQAQARLTDAEQRLAALSQPAAAKLEKLSASPQALQEKAIATLERQLAVTQEKLAQAQAEQSPSLNALSLAVEKLQHKLTEARQQLPQCSPVAKTPDAATLAAAQAALDTLAAKRQQTPEQRMAHRRASLAARIAQLEEQLLQAQAEKSPLQPNLEASLAQLRQKLAELPPEQSQP